jgi:hypothetical protein
MADTKGRKKHKKSGAIYLCLLCLFVVFVEYGRMLL